MCYVILANVSKYIKTSEAKKAKTDNPQKQKNYP